MTARKPVEDMSLSELNDLIDSLTEAEMRMMLTDVARYRPEAFDRALASVWVDGSQDEGTP